MTFSTLPLKFSTLILLVFGISQHLFAQDISVNDNYAQEAARILQLSGNSSITNSFAIKPVDLTGDSLLNTLAGSRNLSGDTNIFSLPVIFRMLPANFISQYNANRPFGYNQGSMFPNRGIQELFSAGFYLSAGFLKIQVKPEFVYAQNKPFATFADVQGTNNMPALFNAYFETINGIDAPERFGNGALNKLYPGQSKITLNFGKLEAGISTENIWWGPGVRNSIMMSNSAPGFLHWTINSSSPVKTAIGSFEWQIIGGYLKQSGYLPTDTSKLLSANNLFSPKPRVTRYVSAFTFNWHPKWIDGFFLGFTEYDYLNIDSTYRRKSIFGRIIPVVVGSSNKANTITTTSNGDGQDFAFAVNVRQVLPAYKAEIYFEWARNDHSGGLNDFLQEPEHSSAYTFGGRRLFQLNNNQLLQVEVEATHLQNQPTYLLRQEPTWYVHLFDPRDGYTNDGRYVGAGIGPGGNSLLLNVSLLSGKNSYGLMLERLVHNNDLYYNAFSGTGIYNRHWVDLSNTFYANFKWSNYLVSFELTPVYTLNYEYEEGSSFNLQTELNLTYYFN